MVWLADGEKIVKISLFVLTECTNVTDTDRHTHTHTQGRRHGFESGGGQFCERSEQKIFFDPPTFWPVGGGQNIAYIAKSA